jgi:hypothetical protein
MLRIFVLVKCGYNSRYGVVIGTKYNVPFPMCVSLGGDSEYMGGENTGYRDIEIVYQIQLHCTIGFVSPPANFGQVSILRNWVTAIPNHAIHFGLSR